MIEKGSDPIHLKRKNNETSKDEREKVRIRLYPCVPDALCIMPKRSYWIALSSKIKFVVCRVSVRHLQRRVVRCHSVSQT